MRIRVSYGTAIAMGLIRARMLARPTTAYLMTYYPGHCQNNCAFCPQARGSRADLEKLSRVTWPVFEMDDVVRALPGGRFARACLQTVDYPGLVEDVEDVLMGLLPAGLPVSLSITPVDKAVLERFKSLGVDYVGVGLDVANEDLFDEMKDGLHSWREMWGFAGDVVEVLGRGRAVVHLIVGLGETDRDLLEVVARAHSLGAGVSLFAFTPVKGTRLENGSPPSLRRYRRIQLAIYLLEKGVVSVEDFEFDGNGDLVGFPLSSEELLEAVPPAAFATRGCPGCNRPFYNERPNMEPYNFPTVPSRERVRRIVESIL